MKSNDCFSIEEVRPHLSSFDIVLKSALSMFAFSIIAMTDYRTMQPSLLGLANSE